MNNNKNKTAGQLSQELLENENKPYDPIEIEQEIHTDYEQKILDCANEAKRIYQNDFYVVVLTKREKLLQNIIRTFIFHRASCPTPTFDQIVYHYDRKKDNIYFLWVIPDRYTANLFINNKNDIDESEEELLNNIISFKNGNLDRLAMKLNKEGPYGQGKR